MKQSCVAKMPSDRENPSIHITLIAFPLKFCFFAKATIWPVSMNILGELDGKTKYSSQFSLRKFLTINLHV